MTNTFTENRIFRFDAVTENKKRLIYPVNALATSVSSSQIALEITSFPR